MIFGILKIQKQSNGTCIVNSHNADNEAFSSPLIFCKNEVEATKIIAEIEKLKLNILKIKNGKAKK